MILTFIRDYWKSFAFGTQGCNIECIPHHQVLRSLFGRIEEESTEQWDPHAITQYCQIGLGELECCWVLVHHLPHAVQEEYEQRGLEQKKKRRIRALTDQF